MIAEDGAIGASPKPGDGLRNDDDFLTEIYDIALDPGNLHDFIDRLESQASDIEQSRDELLRIDALSALFRAHLHRAEQFLDRIGAANSANPLQAALEPFAHSGAMLVDPRLRIVALNARAAEVFGVSAEASVDALPFVEDDLDQLVLTVRRLLRTLNRESVLLHMRLRCDGAEDPEKMLVLHAYRLELELGATGEKGSRTAHILLASTELAWPPALDQTLQEVFALTEAERDVVRALVEGKVLKTIARERDRSIGTVRVQVKSILSKTRAHSQSELIRVVLSLMQVVKRAPDPSTRVPGFSSDTADAKHLSFAPFEHLIRPGGRRMQYLVQGDPQGTPIIFSHMGYGLLRWPPKALALAHKHGLKVISPVRPGFGESDKTRKQDDVLAIIREDTAALLDHLGARACTYVVQGNDLLFALDFARAYPERVSALVGLGVRLPLPSEQQYPGMGKWHRFMLSNARHAPHLLYFICKAAFTLARKIGSQEFFRNVHRDSPADLAVLDDSEIRATLLDSSKLALSEKHQAAFAYARELLETESDWREFVDITRSLPSWFVSGLQDPLGSPQIVAAYEAAYPWLSIETIEDAGQLLFFSQFESLIPRIARTARETCLSQMGYAPDL